MQGDDIFCYTFRRKAGDQMESVHRELHRLRRASAPRRVQRATLAILAAFLVTAIGSIGLVLGHRRSPAVIAFGRLFSQRTWKVLEAVTLLALFAITAVARAKTRDRT